MSMKRLFAAAALAAAASFAAAGPAAAQSAERCAEDPRTTHAYAALVVRKAAAEAELADLSAQFTRGSRAVRAKRFELNALGREMESMRGVGCAALPRLSAAYGNLVVSKVSLEVELDELLDNFTPEHPSVKRKRVQLAALVREMEHILGQ
jgi:uncharacterized protein involved in exopolysaccharide biosynthesis